jgi:hypothetical protein
MTYIKKHTVGLLIVALAASALISSESVSAQSISKPSVPEFTVQFIDSSYDIPTTHSYDPYTGQEITNPGYHVDKKSIEVKIKNQPFTPNTVNGQNINLYYNIRVKGHFDGNWTELYRATYSFPRQSTNADYTIFSYTWAGDGETELGTRMITLRDGAQADFQVEAMVGYVADAGPFSDRSPREYFEGEVSGWSNTQTITINENAITSIQPTQPTPTAIVTGLPTQNPTTPNMPQPATQTNLFTGFSWHEIVIVGLVLAVTVLAVALVLSRRKRP